MEKKKGLNSPIENKSILMNCFFQLNVPTLTCSVQHLRLFIRLLSETIAGMKTPSCLLSYSPICHLKDKFNGIGLCSAT